MEQAATAGIKPGTFSPGVAESRALPTELPRTPDDDDDDDDDCDDDDGDDNNDDDDDNNDNGIADVEEDI